MEWKAASGKGSVHTYTIVRQSSDPHFHERVPYVVALIDLDEGVRMLSNVIDCDPQSITIGMRVRCICERIDDDVGIPLFAPERSSP